MLVRNDDPSRVLIIDSAYIWVDVPSELHFHLPVTFTATGGASITAVSLNQNLIKTPLYTAKSDDTAVDVFSTTTTILSIHSNEATADQFPFPLIDFKGMVVLGNDNTLALDLVGAGVAAFNATFFGYYQDK